MSAKNINGGHYTGSDLPPAVVMMHFEKSRTRQSELKASDINTIVAQYDRTGVLPESNREALFEDVSEMPDYRTSLDLIQKADDMFMQLPAGIRFKFDNDAAIFLDWTSDPDNRDEMIEMGMLPKPVVKEVVTPPVVPVANTPDPKGTAGDPGEVDVGSG